MTHQITDEQLDRAVAAYLGERRTELVARATLAHDAAARRGHAPPRRTEIGPRGTLVLLAALLAALLAGAGAIVGGGLLADPVPPSPGAFAPTGSMAIPRTGHTAMLLADGRVVVAGGVGALEPGGDSVALRSAEAWDPRTGEFEPLPFLVESQDERTGYTLTLLPDGRVLVAGGIDSPQALLWDPVTGSLEPAGTLTTPRAHHTATLLPDGRVLIVGGRGEDGEPVPGAEVWSGLGRSFAPAGNLVAVRLPDTATLLPDGRVLVVGEAFETDLGVWVPDNAEVWDPRTSTFGPGGVLSEGHPDHTATLLPDGRVLVIGGMATLPVEMWDPDSASFAIVARLDAETGDHTATLLPDGRVLMIGGYDMRLHWSYDSALTTRAPWDSFEGVASMGEARAGHTATLLPDGRVVVIGGWAGGGRMDEAGNVNHGGSRRDEILRTAEVWSP